MKEINIPYTGIADNDNVEVTVRNCSSNKEWFYRIESLKIDEDKDNVIYKPKRVEKLLNYIRNYDKCWELLNIFNTEKPDGYVHLLYRKQNI